MAKTKPSKKNIEQVKEYVKARAVGMPKVKALKSAGYSDSAARLPYRVERSMSFQIAIAEISQQNADILGISLQSFNERVAKGELNLTTMKEHADIITKLATVHDRLSTKETTKLEQGANGELRASKWVTVSK